MTKPERRTAFAAAAAAVLGILRGEPDAERARLLGLAPDRVELLVPAAEYEAARQVGLGRLPA